MARPSGARQTRAAAEPPPTTGWFLAFTLLGIAASSASTYVHLQLLNDSTYASFCDVSSTWNCTDAYTSRYGSVGGIPVAVLGLLFFVFTLGLIVLCRRSRTAAPNLPGYLFALSTIGLAAVLYLAYASFMVLGAICVLCLGTYVAVIGLFLTSGAAMRYPMTSLPGRAAADLRTLVRTPAALAAAVVFIVAAGASLSAFRGQPVDASTTPPAATATGAEAQTPATPATPAPAAAAALQAGALQQLEQMLSQAPRVPIMVPNGGAAVLLVKFNDYQCPPCRQTFMEYKPILAKYEQQAPGKVRFVTKDYPLDPECNSFAPRGMHPAACEAAVAVRLAREKGRASQMEDWLFANQPAMTPESVREAARTVGNVQDLDARYGSTLDLVRADIAQGSQLQVSGTPTFFMNGIRLPNLRAEFLDAAIAWELKRVSEGGQP